MTLASLIAPSFFLMRQDAGWIDHAGCTQILIILFAPSGTNRLLSRFFPISSWGVIAVVDWQWRHLPLREYVTAFWKADFLYLSEFRFVLGGRDSVQHSKGVRSNSKTVPELSRGQFDVRLNFWNMKSSPTCTAIPPIPRLFLHGRGSYSFAIVFVELPSIPWCFWYHLLDDRNSLHASSSNRIPLVNYLLKFRHLSDRCASGP